MKIAGAIGPTAATRAHEVEPRRTPVTRGEIRAAIARGLERLDGRRPSDATVDVLTAQASLETASGDRMFNFNFGGIKGRSPDGATAVCRTKEIVAGREVATKDGFRAYASLDDGALDYVRTMKQRFGAALAPAARGDVAGFAHALKSAGYYTASEADYTRGLERLAGKADTGRADTISLTKRAPLLASHGSPLDAEGLARVENVLDVSAVSAFSAPPRHENEEDEDA